MQRSAWLTLVSVGGEALLRALSAHTEQSVTQSKGIMLSRHSFLYTGKVMLLPLMNTVEFSNGFWGAT